MSFQEIDTVKSALDRLSSGDYTIAPFKDRRLGLMDKNVGGCWGYFKDGLIQEMINDGYISISGQILKRGFRVLGGVE